jgi:hypothetical protein
MDADGILGTTSTHVLLMKPTVYMTATAAAKTRIASSAQQVVVLGGDRAVIACTDDFPAARVSSG